MTKHTPGPWELSEGNTSLWGRSPLGARVRIADIIQHSSMNGIDWEANARLIASAPYLLITLKSLREQIQTLTEDNPKYHLDHPSLDDADDLIKKLES